MPGGETLSSIFVDPARSSLLLGVTDRENFYHQLAVSKNRAESNRLFPAFCAEDVCETSALKNFLQRSSPKRSCPKWFQPCFASVLQGDHTGVEVATALLQDQGLLSSSTRIEAGKPLSQSDLYDGLVIDDYFCVSQVSRAVGNNAVPSSDTPCRRALDAALLAYGKHELEGSAEKDIFNASFGKIAGGELDSSPATLDKGLCLLSAPKGKRFTLADISLEIASLSATTDSLHLCLLGGWSSVLSYRRPAYCIFDKAFALVPSLTVGPGDPKLVHLPRAAAQELCLAAALSLCWSQTLQRLSTQGFLRLTRLRRRAPSSLLPGAHRTERGHMLG